MTFSLKGQQTSCQLTHNWWEICLSKQSVHQIIIVSLDRKISTAISLIDWWLDFSLLNTTIQSRQFIPPHIQLIHQLNVPPPLSHLSLPPSVHNSVQWPFHRSPATPPSLHHSVIHYHCTQPLSSSLSSHPCPPHCECKAFVDFNTHNRSPPTQLVHNPQSQSTCVVWRDDNYQVMCQRGYATIETVHEHQADWRMDKWSWPPPHLLVTTASAYFRSSSSFPLCTVLKC